jgi:hypothetical protein
MDKFANGEDNSTPTILLDIFHQLMKTLKPQQTMKKVGKRTNSMKLALSQRIWRVCLTV